MTAIRRYLLFGAAVLALVLAVGLQAARDAAYPTRAADACPVDYVMLPGRSSRPPRP